MNTYEITYTTCADHSIKWAYKTISIKAKDDTEAEELFKKIIPFSYVISATQRVS